MAVPTPIKATGSHFYRYASADHLKWLKEIILKHELYLPSLSELNDPADGRPKLAPMSEEKMAWFLISGVVERNPTLPLATLEHEAAVIRYNVRHHGTEVLLGQMSKLLNSELEGYRIYSLSKRFDNLALWAKYAGNHTGYCLEFRNEGPLFACAKEVIYGDATEMDVQNREHRSGYWFSCKRSGMEQRRRGSIGSRAGQRQQSQNRTTMVNAADTRQGHDRGPSQNNSRMG